MKKIYDSKLQDLRTVFDGDRKIVLSRNDGRHPEIAIIPTSGLLTDEDKKHLSGLLQNDARKLADGKLTQVIYWALQDECDDNSLLGRLFRRIESLYRKRMLGIGYQRRVSSVVPVPDNITSIYLTADLRTAHPSLYRWHRRYSLMLMLKYILWPRESMVTELSDFRKKGTVFKHVTRNSAGLKIFFVSRVFQEMETALAEKPEACIVIYCVPEYVLDVTRVIINKLQLIGSVHPV